MWLLICLASTCGEIEGPAKWEQLGKGDKALWRVGVGSTYCYYAGHITSACVTVEASTGEKKTFCSNARYTDQAMDDTGIPYPASPNPDIPCVPTRESHRSLAKRHENWPHRHSEIAALQHLFGIDGSKTPDNWADCIKEVLTGKVNHFLAGAKSVQVWLYNMHHAPCTDSATKVRKGVRCPCDTFLRRLVEKVNTETPDHIHFGIQVRFDPNTPPVQYGEVQLSDEPGTKMIREEAKNQAGHGNRRAPRRRRRRVRRHYAALF